MASDEESRYRFFSERGVAAAAEFDKVLVTLFTGIIAGITALVVSSKVGVLSGAAFAVAAVMAVVGLAFCLLHMTFTAKTMLLLAAMFGGEGAVPNVVGREEPTERALVRNRGYAQRCYEGQFLYLMLSVAFAALGLMIELWQQVLLGVLIGIGILVLMLTITVVFLRRRVRMSGSAG